MFGRHGPWTQLRIKLSAFRLVEKLHDEKSGRRKGFTVGINFFNVAAERTFPVVKAKNRLKTSTIRLLFFLFFCNNARKDIIIIAPFKRILPDLPDFIHFPYRNLCEEVNGFFRKAFAERLPVLAKAKIEHIYFQQEFKHNQLTEGNLPLVQEGVRHVFYSRNHSRPSLVGKLLVKQVLLVERFITNQDIQQGTDFTFTFQ